MIGNKGWGIGMTVAAMALAWCATLPLGAQIGAKHSSSESGLGAQPASQADRDFVAKVSQGGLYEVEAGKVAAVKGQTAFIQDFGVLEAHDHERVGADLKRIATATGVTIKPGLNSEFSARLAKLKAVSAGEFEAFYIADMKGIHTKDEGLFAAEANDGTAPYKAFAHATAVLVNAHLGWLNTQ